MAGAKPFVDAKLMQRKVILFSKSYSPECNGIKDIMDRFDLSDKDYEVIEIEKRQDCTQIENYFQILCLTDSRAVPQLFINGRYVGGEKELHMLQRSGELAKMIEEVKAS
ncbi:glutaredoxin-like [Plakobranchus ocellatus]|uniref:Glutaredoxin-like n=1 Tax=Plakobranchus ocellatus TaxID=259542 RepID=A0AAV4DTF3_9GAST|nr:glutaredoxin-like [Plakobranchus ocellatus]